MKVRAGGGRLGVGTVCGGVTMTTGALCTAGCGDGSAVGRNWAVDSGGETAASWKAGCCELNSRCRCCRKGYDCSSSSRGRVADAFLALSLPSLFSLSLRPFTLPDAADADAPLFLLSSLLSVLLSVTDVSVLNSSSSCCTRSLTLDRSLSSSCMAAASGVCRC